MKNALRKLCWPVLAFFEKGELAISYRPSHRVILLAVATLDSDTAVARIWGLK